MIKLYLNVSDFIHANQHAQYANCDLLVTSEFFANVISFSDVKEPF